RFVADFIGEANFIECLVDGNGNLRTEKSGSPLPYSLPGPHASKATLMLRPECLTLGGDGDRAGYVKASGTVQEVIYAGSISRVYLCCDIDDEIMITQNT